MWFELRREFEDAMERSFNGQVRRPLISGEYEEENFLGYCHRSGGYCQEQLMTVPTGLVVQVSLKQLSTCSGLS